ncbi:hypothetical protein [Mycolicibacterium sphagni]|uniref:Uncharacterized protein n=1 Tax=Mycolicibacterium sphagni TaxID=1786 RepID=A0ABX2JMI0_9MYCO|nr:hypothetical protein [Mycolicibacterium sphagni]NTY58675.1 hypothetical protein [Mycolicibacterium sphagni]
MRLLAKRDLGSSVTVDDGRTRVLISIGPLRFTATRGEAIQLAAAIVAAVDALAAEPQGLA